jgi:hypothetical protein
VCICKLSRAQLSSASGGDPHACLVLNRDFSCAVALRMHIHIAHWESSRPVAGVPFGNWLARRWAAATKSPVNPRHLQGYWVKGTTTLHALLMLCFACPVGLQMHIHIAHWESSRSVAGVPFANWLARRVAAATEVSSNPQAPTRILGEGYYNPAAWVQTPLGRPPRNWARVYAIHVASSDPVNDLGVSRVGFALILQSAVGAKWVGRARPWCVAYTECCC